MPRTARAVQRQKSELAEETARILFLTYGHDAVDMALLRCSELNNYKAGDKAGLASWKKVLNNVRKRQPQT